VTIARFRVRHEQALAGFLVHGQARGDELPQALASKAARLARLHQAKALLEAEAAQRARRFTERAAASAAAANLTQLPNAPELLILPPKHGRHGKPRKDGKPSASRSDGLRAAMTARLQSEDGKACYAKRKETVEPVFGQIKDGRGARRSGSCCAAPTTCSSGWS
jgi:Transposase DDE domain